MSSLSSPVVDRRGFTLVEVLVAMTIAIMVLGTVFGLLARGQRTYVVESARTDVQSQARRALETMKRDILEAGANLPPEFPAFTPPGVNPELGDLEDGALEVVGAMTRDGAAEGPVPVVDFDGREARLLAPAPYLRRGDLVLVYDDEPTNGSWVFGIVTAVATAPPRALLETTPGAHVDETVLPPFVQAYNRSLPRRGFLTPVTVVSYRLEEEDDPAGGDPRRVLTRRVNWSEPKTVAYVDDLEIRYFVGTTTEPASVGGQSLPPGPWIRPWGKAGLDSAPTATDDDGPAGSPPSPRPPGPTPEVPPAEPAPARDELAVPPVPQPDPTRPVDGARIVHSVRITVSGLSREGGLEGGRDEGHLRVSYTSSVAARNLLFRLASRRGGDAFN